MPPQTDRPPQSRPHTTPRYSTRLTAVAASAILSVTLLLSAAPPSRADSLTDEQARIKAAQAQSRTNYAEYSRELQAAAAQLAESEQNLAAARSELAQAQRRRAAAVAEDARIAKALTAARLALSRAKAEVIRGQLELDTQIGVVGASVRETQQQRNNLVGVAVLVTDLDTNDVNSRLQWSETIFATTQAQVDRLTELQSTLQSAKEAQGAAEAAVAKQKAAAEVQVSKTKAAEQAASEAAAAVRQMVAANATARANAERRVAAERQNQQRLDAEAAAVAGRIQERIEAQKREAARQAAAEARARAEAAAAQRAADAAAARRSSDSAAKAAAAKAAADRAQQASRSKPVSSNRNFYYPVSAPITSPYGMRLHPVLGYWKLHDGTDFGAGCGAPIRAPGSGVVTQRYYNEGYGNRLMIDHGLVGGSYITTGYNHASGYVVGVGQRVSSGQIIGYVGTTGYSTGCHLHLMVWQNGSVVNPMRWF